MDNLLLDKHKSDPAWAEVMRLYSGLFDTQDERETFILDVAEEDILLAAECKTSSVEVEEKIVDIFIRKIEIDFSFKKIQIFNAILVLLELRGFETLMVILTYISIEPTRNRRKKRKKSTDFIPFNQEKDYYILKRDDLKNIIYLTSKESLNHLIYILSKHTKYWNLIFTIFNYLNFTNLKLQNIDIQSFILKIQDSNQYELKKYYPQVIVIICIYDLPIELFNVQFINECFSLFLKYRCKSIEIFENFILSEYKFLRNKFSTNYINENLIIDNIISSPKQKNSKIKMLEILEVNIQKDLSFYKKIFTNSSSDIVMCSIKNIIPSRIFVKIESETRPASIYIGELTNQRLLNINDFEYNGEKLHIGQKLVAKVISIDEQGRINLSLKQVQNGE